MSRNLRLSSSTLPAYLKLFECSLYHLSPLLSVPPRYLSLSLSPFDLSPCTTLLRIYSLPESHLLDFHTIEAQAPFSSKRDTVRFVVGKSESARASFTKGFRGSSILFLSPTRRFDESLPPSGKAFIRCIAQPQRYQQQDAEKATRCQILMEEKLEDDSE